LEEAVIAIHRTFCVALFILASVSFAPATEPLLGVFGGNSMESVLAFEKWLGRPVDQILCTVDYQKWENYRYAEWLSKTVYGQRGDRRLVYDVPIIINGATYAEAVTGAYDSHWECLATSIIQNNPGTYEIVVRPSHEMNGEWTAWEVGGKRQAEIPDFITSWKRFHGVFRKVPGGDRFRFSFSTTEGGSDPRPMWPGDEFVDFVSQDVYFKPKSMGLDGWETEDALEAWKSRAENRYDAWRLGAMYDFAKARGKPFQIDEWGVSGPNAGVFVKAMAEWLRAHGARAHTYWNSDQAFLGRLDSRATAWPGTVGAFKQAFGAR
jgi:hypothetical protein